MASNLRVRRRKVRRRVVLTTKCDTLRPAPLRRCGRSRNRGDGRGPARGECLSDEQPGRSVCRADGRRLVEQRPGVENLEHFRMRTPDGVQVRICKEGRQLARTRCVDALEESVVAVGRERQPLVRVELGRRRADEHADTAKYSSITNTGQQPLRMRSDRVVGVAGPQRIGRASATRRGRSAQGGSRRRRLLGVGSGTCALRCGESLVRLAVLRSVASVTRGWL